MIPALSPTTLATCRQHWGTNGSGCGRCPIHRPCTSGTGPLSWPAIAVHVERLNAAAEAHAQTTPAAQTAMEF